MSDAPTTSAPAPSAPATSADTADSVSVGTRSHQPPQRASRSSRESGEPTTRRDPTAPPPKRKEAEPRVREALEKPLTAEFKEALEKKAAADGEEANEEPAVEATGEDPSEPQAEELKTEVEYPAEVKEKLEEAEKFRTEVTAKAQEVLRENAGLSRKLEWLMEAIDAADLEIDPQALELFDLRTEKELGADFTKKAQEQAENAKKASHEKAVQAEVTKVNAEIAKAAKDSKVDETTLKARWAANVKVWQHTGGKGEMPTLEDAVFEIKAVSDAKQVKTSTSAPSLIRSKGGGTSAAQPRFPNTFDGWRRRLKSQGFAD